MPEHLVRKLEHFVKLSAAEKALLAEVAAERVRQRDAREDIFSEGEPPRWVNLILEGYACRYKTLEDGRRQIIGLLVPGDLCDARMFILRTLDHSVATLTPARVAEIDKERMLEISDFSPRLTRAMWWNSLVEESIGREWVVSVGRRSARERMAHLFCELFVRLRTVGLTRANSCAMPMTQPELGESLGISAVHVNRTLQDLRADGLVTLERSTLTIHDLDALMREGLFTDVYLHLDHAGHAMDANER